MLRIETLSKSRLRKFKNIFVKKYITRFSREKKVWKIVLISSKYENTIPSTGINSCDPT